jgi:hypothetical protein
VVFPVFVAVAASERQGYLGVFKHHRGKSANEHPKQRPRAAKIYRARNPDDIAHSKRSRKRKTKRARRRYARFFIPFEYERKGLYRVAQIKKAEIKIIKHPRAHKRNRQDRAYKITAQYTRHE